MSLPVPLLPNVLPADAAWVVIIDHQQPYEGPSVAYFARRQDAEAEVAKRAEWVGKGPVVMLCEVRR